MTPTEQHEASMTKKAKLMIAAGTRIAAEAGIAVAEHGGDRQVLHERLRTYSFEAQDAVRDGKANPLIGRITRDPDFGLSPDEVAEIMEPARFVGRSPEQVDEFLAEHVEPALADIETMASKPIASCDRTDSTRRKRLSS